MNILIETCLDDLLIILIKNNKTINFIHKKNIKKKSDNLPIFFQKLINDSNVNIDDIKSFYVTNGPGSFMGVRAGLLFAATICGIKGKKLFVCSSLKFIKGGSNKNIFWDAKGNKSYALIDSQYKIVEKKPNTKINYKNIMKKIDIHLNLFKEVNPFENNTFYLKEPRIG